MRTAPLPTLNDRASLLLDSRYRHAMNLTLRKIWPNDPQHENDFVVVLDGKTDLARIRLDTLAYRKVVWSWSVFGFAIGQDSSMRGNAETFEEAKAKTKAQSSASLQPELN